MSIEQVSTNQGLGSGTLIRGGEEGCGACGRSFLGFFVFDYEICWVADISERCSEAVCVVNVA